MKNIFLLFFSAHLVWAASAQSCDEWIDSSFVALDNGNLAEAENALLMALRLKPADKLNALLWSNIGTIQRQAEKYTQAVESYTIALAQNPLSVTVLQNRATLYADMGKSDDAINDYTSVLQLESDNNDALYYRGLIYLQTGNEESAETDFKKLLALNPESLQGKKGLATLEKLRGNYVEAEKIYSHLIKTYPLTQDLYIARAELYLLSGSNARALGDINRVILDMKPDAYCYYLRAKIKINLYEKKSAIKDLIAAKEAGYPLGELEEFLKKEQKGK